MDEYLWSQIISRTDPITRIAFSLTNKEFYRLAKPIWNFGPVLNADSLSGDDFMLLMYFYSTLRCSTTVKIDPTLLLCKGRKDLIERLVFVSQPQQVTLHWGNFGISSDCITLEPFNGQVWLDMFPLTSVPYHDVWLSTKHPAEIKLIYHSCWNREWIVEPERLVPPIIRTLGSSWQIMSCRPVQVALDTKIYVHCGMISSKPQEFFLCWRDVWEPRWKSNRPVSTSQA